MYPTRRLRRKRTESEALRHDANSEWKDLGVHREPSAPSTTVAGMTLYYAKAPEVAREASERATLITRLTKRLNGCKSMQIAC
jgi:glycogen debranching enzyme